MSRLPGSSRNTLAAAMSTATFLALVLLATGCGDEASPAASAPPEPSGPAVHLLTSSPSGAMSVLQALDKGEGDEVVVEGRVSKIRKGVGAFSLTDTSVPYCDQGEAEAVCTTPWDYCCHEAAAKKGSLSVELRGEDGRPVPDLNTGLRLLDLAVVRGTLAKTEDGTPVLLVSNGWFRKERPKLPDGLDWSE